MAPKKTVPAKQHCLGSTSQVAPPPPDDPCRFFSREAERLYHLQPFIRSGEGFSYLKRIIQLHHPDQRMADTVCSPDPQSGPCRTRVPSQPGFPSWHHLSRVGRSTSGHGPSTRSISYGRATMKSTRRYLWPLTSRA